MVQVPALTYGQVCENVEVINWTEKGQNLSFAKGIKDSGVLFLRFQQFFGLLVG